MSEFNASEAERLARELAEDASGFKGEFRFVEAHTEDHGIGNIGDFVSVPDRLVYIDAIDGDPHTIVDDIEQHIAEPIARMLNNARAASEQLRAACEEVERLRKLNGDWAETASEQLAEADAARALANIANECRASAERELERWRHGVTVEGDYVCPDSLALTEARALVERLKELNKHIHSIAWTAGRREAEQAMAPNLAALTSDLAKYRALVEQMRPVYEAAVKMKEIDEAHIEFGEGVQATPRAVRDAVVNLYVAIDTALAAPRKDKNDE